MINDPPATGAQVEPFIPVSQAAEALGIQRWKLWRAIKAELVPSYTFLNKRRLVKLSEVVAVIERTKTGGGKDEK